MWTILIFNSLLLGVALAMDAFSVSLANGLNDSQMNKSKIKKIVAANNKKRNLILNFFNPSLII